MTAQFRESGIHYATAGEAGPWVLLLHGFLEDSRIYEGIAATLSKRYRLVAIDLPGHGRTPPLGYRHSMDDMAEAVQAVLRHLSISRCSLVGHSMGGYVSLAFAERWPEQVDGLCLFHSTALADSDQKRADRNRAASLVRRGKQAFVQAAVPSLFAPVSKAALEEGIETLVQRASAFSARGIIANIIGMRDRPDRTHVLARAQFPVLFIHGTEDPVVSTEAVLRQASLHPQTQVEILDGVGHMGYLERPSACTAALLRFLSGPTGSSQ